MDPVGLKVLTVQMIINSLTTEQGDLHFAGVSAH